MVLQNLPRLEMAIREGRETDKPLVNWWLHFLLLSWITLGVYTTILFLRRINRRDKHFARVKDLFEAALECTKEVAQNKGSGMHYELRGIEQKLRGAAESLLKPKGSVLWFFLTFITLGIAALYVSYFLTRDWYRIQRFEQGIVDDLNKVWFRIGVTKYAIEVEMTVPERNFWLYLGLSIITLGILALYWDYCIHTDPDRVFKENERWEATMLSCFRNI